MNTPALEVVGLSKYFGALHVIRDIDLRLEAGARHALIGPNGAGKTTLVNLVTGRQHPNTGQIFLAGREITNMPQSERARLGLCRTFQINSLFAGLSVIENVYLSISERERIAWHMIRSAGSHRAILDEAYEIVASFGLEAVAGRLVRTLSYGQQRLIEIAVAMALRPSVLLLDEPAAGVPSGESTVILDALERLPAQVAVLLIEHDMDIVFRFARLITVLDCGQILAEATPSEIAANDEVRRIYFGEGEMPLHG
jgi:ABC-type branched-subunit amino acid transport system ATPase component